MQDTRIKELESKALAMATWATIEELTEDQEAIVLADLREGGTADSQGLAELLAMRPQLVAEVRLQGRQRVLERVQHLVGDCGWEGLVAALGSSERPIAGSKPGS